MYSQRSTRFHTLFHMDLYIALLEIPPRVALRIPGPAFSPAQTICHHDKRFGIDHT